MHAGIRKTLALVFLSSLLLYWFVMMHEWPLFNILAKIIACIILQPLCRHFSIQGQMSSYTFLQSWKLRHRRNDGLDISLKRVRS